VFIVGADLNAVLALESENESAVLFLWVLTSTRAREMVANIHDVFQSIENLPLPTIALMNGTALGGGLELALVCDYRIASVKCNDIGLPEVKLGLVPAAGGLTRLPRLIGLNMALPLILSGLIVVYLCSSHCR
jgi:enoyl-CoA hydratase/carnithine racemase